MVLRKKSISAVSTEMENRLEAAEMWFYRRMLRISRTESTLLKTLRRRQLQFLEHVMRKERL